MVSPSHEAKTPPSMVDIAPTPNRCLRVLGLGAMFASILATGCAPVMHKSKSCMDEPLRHYMQSPVE